MLDLIQPTDHVRARFPTAFGYRPMGIAPTRREIALAEYLERQRAWREESATPSNRLRLDPVAQPRIWAFFQALSRLKASL